MVKSLRNNRNNRLRSRKNLRSKSQRHNTQHGGEEEYVRALYDYKPSSKDTTYAGFNKDDIILVTDKRKVMLPKGINTTNKCEKIIYIPHFVEPYIPSDGNTKFMSSISDCKLFDQKKQEAIDECLEVCGKQNGEYCQTHMSKMFTFKKFQEKPTEKPSTKLLECANGRRILEPTLMRAEYIADDDAADIMMSPKRRSSSSSSPVRSSSSSLGRSSSSSPGRSLSRTLNMPRSSLSSITPSTVPLFYKSIGYCGRKGNWGGRSNCVVLKHPTSGQTDKVVLYVNPRNNIEVRFFKTDPIKHYDTIILKDDNYELIIIQIKNKLGLFYESNVDSARNAVNELYEFINETHEKDPIYKGEVLLEFFERLRNK